MNVKRNSGLAVEVTSRVWDFLSNALDGWGSLAIRVRDLRLLVFPLGRSTYLVFF